MADLIKAADKEIVDSTEYRTHLRVNQFQISVRIFQVNYSELHKLLEFVNNPFVALGLWQQGAQGALSLSALEIQRLFSNFLASAFSLVGHARKFMSNYKETPFENEYKQQIESCFIKNGLHNFIQGLRNQFMHDGIPIMPQS